MKKPLFFPLSKQKKKKNSASFLHLNPPRSLILASNPPKLIKTSWGSPYISHIRMTNPTRVARTLECWFRKNKDGVPFYWKKKGVHTRGENKDYIIMHHYTTECDANNFKNCLKAYKLHLDHICKDTGGMCKKG